MQDDLGHQPNKSEMGNFVCCGLMRKMRLKYSEVQPCMFPFFMKPPQLENILNSKVGTLRKGGGVYSTINRNFRGVEIISLLVDQPLISAFSKWYKCHMFFKH